MRHGDLSTDSGHISKLERDFAQVPFWLQGVSVHHTSHLLLKVWSLTNHPEYIYCPGLPDPAFRSH